METDKAAPRCWFFHGKESSPHGKKYQELKKVHRKIKSLDFRGQDLETRLTTAENATRNLQNLILVGSSMGGLVAALLYQRYPERIANYLLLAPAFQRPAAQEITRMPPKAIILHGNNDTVVPLEAVRAQAERFKLDLQILEDDHRLMQSLEFMKSAFRQLLQASSP